MSEELKNKLKEFNITDPNLLALFELYWRRPIEEIDQDTIDLFYWVIEDFTDTTEIQELGIELEEDLEKITMDDELFELEDLDNPDDFV